MKQINIYFSRWLILLALVSCIAFVGSTFQILQGSYSISSLLGELFIAYFLIHFFVRLPYCFYKPWIVINDAGIATYMPSHWSNPYSLKEVLIPWHSFISIERTYGLRNEGIIIQNAEEPYIVKIPYKLSMSRERVIELINMKAKEKRVGW